MILRYIKDLKHRNRVKRILSKAIGREFIGGNSVKLLKNGASAFPEMLNAISSATSTINLEIYMFKDDNIGTKFQRLLIKKALEGVEVRIIYDATGSFGTKSSFFKEMEEAGVKIRAFNKFYDFFSKKPTRLSFHYRNHKKLLIVDGKVAFLGGLNIADEYDGNAQDFNHWRDNHVRIEGPAVSEIQKHFIYDWYKVGGDRIHLEKHIIPNKRKGKAMIQVVSTRYRRHRKQIRRNYRLIILLSEHYIYIINPYFVPDRGVFKALIDRAKEGLDVRILLPAKNDVAIVKYASEGYYEELLKNGVKVYEYQKTMIHSKIANIDEVLTTIGSANLDYRSFFHNFEISANIMDKRFAREVKEMFLEDIRDAIEIKYEQWVRRSFKKRILGFIISPFKYWL